MNLLSRDYYSRISVRKANEGQTFKNQLETIEVIQKKVGPVKII
jgi:hypothetical protein